MTDTQLLFRKAIVAALRAGNEIMSVYNSAPEIELKADKSPLTIADKKSHQAIASALAETGLPVLSEEGRTIPYEERKDWKSFWMVDPLDGTKEFIKKNGEFTVNIALIENHKSVMGVIYLPVDDILFFGSTWMPSRIQYHAASALRNEKDDSIFYDKLLLTSLLLPLNKSERLYTVVASRSHLSPETAEFVSQLKDEHGELAFISKGSSIKICLVAEGVADIYPRLAPTMEWDTAAGQAIAENAGCTMFNYQTEHPVIYNKEHLLNPYFVVRRT